MLSDDSLVVVDPETGYELNKRTIKSMVRSLFRAECAHSINPDEKVTKEFAAELVNYLLEPE